MSHYKVNKGFIVQKLDEKIVIFDAEESLLYTFNETASYIFQKIKLGWEKEKIIASLVKRYGITEKKAKKDFQEFLSSLKEKKIISWTKRPSKKTKD